MPHPLPVPRRVAELDWSRWTPDDRATLIFVVEPTRVLLIEKKRGLGAGKVNGPGGRLEPGETSLACALRELHEELGVKATTATRHGTLAFQFTAGYALACEVFRTEAIVGEPVETDEAVPLWSPLDAIPYDRMWADDRLWLPTLLARGTFDGRFVFDDDRMLDHALELRPVD